MSTTELIRAGDLVGWDRALACVIEEYGHLPYPWELLAEVRLPIQRAPANTGLVHDLARVLFCFQCSVSQRRKRLWLVKGRES